MNRLRSALSFCLSLLLVATPMVSSAQVLPQGQIQITTRDQNGQEIVIQIPRSSPEEIRKTAPKTLMNEYFVKPTLDSAKRFLPESALFYTAIGAVTLLQLATDFSSNPMRAQQQLEQVSSPIGNLSFFLFMEANGITTKALMSTMKNPAFMEFIPYLGMTAGYFIQSGLSSFAGDANVKACVAGILAKKKQDPLAENPCDLAFNRYAVGGKILDMTPGLISMLAATIAAGVIQKGVAGVSRYLVLRMIGFDIAPYLVPGAGEIALGARLAVQAVQMGLFVYINDQWMSHQVNYLWKSAIDGYKLTSLEDELTQLLNRKKANHWKDEDSPFFCQAKDGSDCLERDLSAALKATHEQMAAWRMLNLSDVYESHQLWQEKLGGLLGQYSATKAFDQELLQEVRNSKWKFAAPFKLEMSDPLFGVSPKVAASDKFNESILYTKPLYAQGLASLKAKEVGAMMAQDLSDSKIVMMENEKLEYMKFAQDLQSDNVNLQGLTIKEIKRLSLNPVTGNLNRMMVRVMKRLGTNAEYFPEPGRGFLARLENYSSVGKEIREYPFDRGQSSKSVSQFLLVKSICGANAAKNESVVESVRGFKSQFNPPKLTSGAPEIEQMICRGNFDDASPEVFFHLPLRTKNEKYQGLLDFAVKNISSDVLGEKEEASSNDNDDFASTTNDSHFEKWWKQTTEVPMKTAYEQFAAQYTQNMVKMLKAFRQPEDSLLNGQVLDKNPLFAIRQQMRLDLMIIGEMVKDLYIDQNKSAIAKSAFTSKAEPDPISMAINNGETLTPVGLFRLLQKGGATPAAKSIRYKTHPEFYPLETSILEWNHLMGKGPVIGHALQFQKEIEYEIEKLIWMLGRIHIGEKNGVAVVQSDLENSEIEEQTERVHQTILATADFLGIGETPKVGALRNLTGEQTLLLKTAFEGLQGLTSEISLYASMPNSVSWEKILKMRQGEVNQGNYNAVMKAKIKRLSGSLTKLGTSN